MGLIQVASSALESVLADQWREYFYCPALDVNVLAVKGEKRKGKRNFNTKGSDNLITNGSIVAVNEGQCMMIVDQGAVVEVCAEAGQFIYDTSTEPSIFYGSLSAGIAESFKTFGRRFTMGGDTGKDQRIYFFNTKEIMGNKYGTANPVPFRVVDENIGLDMDIAVRCHGEYAYKITDPILFYKNVCGNIETEYTRERIDSQLRSDLLTALQPAFARISEMGVRYSALPGHTDELSDILGDVLSEKWGGRYGIAISSIGVNSVKAPEEDEKMIKELQRNAAFRNPTMAAAHLVSAQAEAMQSAAANKSAGPMMAFAGMNMAGNMGGFQANELFAMGAQNGQENRISQEGADRMNVAGQPGTAAGQTGTSGQAGAAGRTKDKEGEKWICACGTANTGKFCMECGKARPAGSAFWICSCGTKNKGKFCMECGKAKPAGVPQYRCDKCGWEPEDPKKPPKFCPECGDPFDDGDIVG